MSQPKQGADYFRYRSGLNSVGAYQISGIPYATSSIKAPPPDPAGTTLEIAFPRITKWVTIENTGVSGSLASGIGGGGVRVGFSDNGVRSNLGQNYYFVVPPVVGSPSGSVSANSRITLDIRVQSIFLMSNDDNQWGRCQVVAGLTTIPTASIPGFTNWTGSSGVG